MSPRRKILFVSDKNACTSFGRLTVDLFRALGDSFDTSVLWLKTPRYFPDAEESIAGKTIRAFSLETGYFTFRAPFRRFLRETRPDIVLFIRPELGFLIPCVRSALPESKAVVEIHDTFAETLYPHSIKFKLIVNFFVRNTVFADGFVYVSEYARREAEKFYGIADRASAVVGNPINTEVFSPSCAALTRDARREFRESHKIKGFRGMCLTVNLDEPRKNLETYWRLAEKRKDVAFVRIGRLTPGVAARIASGNLKNVFHFTEMQAGGLRDFYRFADLFVFPSFLEGFGLPPLEALACGTPAVCAGTSALAENLQGVCPLVTPADDVDGYLKSVDDALAGRLAPDAGKVNALLSKFSKQAVAERFAAFFEKILK